MVVEYSVSKTDVNNNIVFFQEAQLLVIELYTNLMNNRHLFDPLVIKKKVTDNVPITVHQASIVQGSTFQ